MGRLPRELRFVIKNQIKESDKQSTANDEPLRKLRCFYCPRSNDSKYSIDIPKVAKQKSKLHKTYKIISVCCIVI